MEGRKSSINDLISGDRRGQEPHQDVEEARAGVGREEGEEEGGEGKVEGGQERRRGRRVGRGRPLVGVPRREGRRLISTPSTTHIGSGKASTG